jgi:GrpB-like predicted nucleotidyltransferase (UPF0157 family)
MSENEAEVHVVAYDSAWPARFEVEREALTRLLGAWLVSPIEHIGSTAVPGLAAKPVIDMMAPVRDLESARPALGALAALEYLYFPYKPDLMHWLCKPSPAFRTHHLHLVPFRSSLWCARLAFRDALRAEPELAAEYAALKQRLAERYRFDREAYTDAKLPFVQRVVLHRQAAVAAEQRHELNRLLAHNPVLQTILERAPQLGLAAYYVGAGAISQTVWNLQSGRRADADIKDYDFVYHDASDTSYEAEDRVIRRVRALLADVAPSEGPGCVEVRNEARVHLWYEQRFGHAIEPYRSLEDAIDSWPTTATSIGVRRDASGALEIHAPFGLDDLLSAVVRPNKRQVTRVVYEAKAARWKACWPHLRIMQWDA